MAQAKLRATSRYGLAACMSAPLLIYFAVKGEYQWLYLLIAVVLLYANNNRFLAYAVLLLTTLIPLELLPATPHYLPRTYDAALWNIDSFMGLNMQPFAMTAMQNLPVLHGICRVAYEAYILGIVLAALVGHDAKRFIAKIAMATLVGSLFYLIIPACGPRFYLTSTATAPRNCMPSLHTVWALMVRYHVRGRGVMIRVAADLFLLFTLIATIGFGEHYFVDLIAAVPFWLVLEYGCCSILGSVWLTQKLQRIAPRLAGEGGFVDRPLKDQLPG